MRWIIAFVTYTLPAVFLIVSTWVLLPDEARAAQVHVDEQENATTTPAGTTFELPRGPAYYGAWSAPTSPARSRVGGIGVGLSAEEAQAQAIQAANTVAGGIVLMVVFGIAIPISIAFALNVPIVAGPVSVVLSITMFVVGLIMVIAGSAKIQEIKRQLAESMLSPQRTEPRGFLASAQTYHGVALSTPKCIDFRF